MSNNFSDAQLAELGDVGLGMLACDYYAYTIDNQPNKDFIAGYQKLYPGRVPDSAGLWRLAGRHDVLEGSEGHRWRHHACQGHRGHVEHERWTRRPAR